MSRVSVSRGHIACPTARFVIRHAQPYMAAPSQSGPRGWECYHSTAVPKLVITCTSGQREVKGRF